MWREADTPTYVVLAAAAATVVRLAWRPTGGCVTVLGPRVAHPTFLGSAPCEFVAVAAYGRRGGCW